MPTKTTSGITPVNPRTGRKLKTKKGIDRRVKHHKHPPKRRSIRLRRSTGKQKLAAKLYRKRRKLRETPMDKKIDSMRAKHLRELRKKPKGLQKQAIANKSATKMTVPVTSLKPTKPTIKPTMSHAIPVQSPDVKSLAMSNPSIHSLFRKAMKAINS